MLIATERSGKMKTGKRPLDFVSEQSVVTWQKAILVELRWEDGETMNMYR